MTTGPTASRLTTSLAWHLYRGAKSFASATRLKRSRLFRMAVARLNAVGGAATCRLLLRKDRPALVAGHPMYLAGAHTPSPAFSTTLLLDRYERSTTRLFERVIRPGMVVVDVGAHIGYYTLLAARLVGPTGKVYAFEPEPENYGLLEKNLVLNSCRNVTALPIAVTDAASTTRLFISPQGNDRHSIYANPRSVVAEPTTLVATTSLDRFLAAEGWPRVDFIKMDIEGAEPLALTGMRELLQRADALILVVEFAPESLRAGGFEPIELLRRLRATDFDLASIEEDGVVKTLDETDFADFVRALEVQGVRNLLCTRGPRPSRPGGR